MEDALVQATLSRSWIWLVVLILVLMEDALVQGYFCYHPVLWILVLILVLMEDALVQQNLGYALFKRIVRLDCAS